MASPTGGQFVFSNGSQTVHLGLSQNGSVPTATKAGTDLNIEVFVNPTGTTLPTLAAGFDAGVIVTDSINGVAITGSTNQELLGGQTLTLFGGNYQVNDNSTDTVMSVHQAVTIQGGSGNQTLIGAAGDTIVGGSGAQVLDSGKESILGGSGPETIFGSFGDTITAGSGNTLIFGMGDASNSGGMRITVGTGAGVTDTIFGSLGVTPDTLLGGSANAYVQALGKGDIVNFANETGNSTIQASAGSNAITLGGGAATVFGGSKDSVIGGSGTDLIFGGQTGDTIKGITPGGGLMSITVGTSGNETIYGSLNPTSLGADTLLGGAASAYVDGLGAGDLINFANQSGSSTINATFGNVAVTLGSGASTVFGGVGDTITAGSGTQYVDATKGGMRVVVGSAGGQDSFAGSTAGTAGDTFLGGAAAVTVNGATGDIISFGNQTGAAVIQDSKTFGVAATLGGGLATMYGGAGDSVTFGSGHQIFQDSAGGATITLGSAGLDEVTGSSKLGSPDTIVAGKGSAANLLFNPGSTQVAGEVINLAQSTGSNTVNAFQTGFVSKDTITAGSGSDSVYAGGGSRVVVGTATQAAGSHDWFDSDPATGGVVFGTNDTVAGEKYGNTAGAVTATGAAGSSTATVTVGGFNVSTDSIFYASRSTANLDSSIIATAQSSGNTTTLVLPDGTTMILAGVSSAAGLKFTS